jgi:hypothetical protein
MERVLALSLVNNHLGVGIVPTGTVFAHKLAVFACWSAPRNLVHLL